MSDRLEPDPLPRRDFLGLAGLWAAGIAIFGSLLGMARLPKPNVLPEASTRFRVGKAEELAPGTRKLLPERNVELVVTQSGVAAISLVCTHLGCIVAHTADGFGCPCHGSKFGPDGEVLRGPAPRGLRWLEVSEAADGSLLVDSSHEVAPATYYEV